MSGTCSAAEALDQPAASLATPRFENADPPYPMKRPGAVRARGECGAQNVDFPKETLCRSTARVAIYGRFRQHSQPERPPMTDQSDVFTLMDLQLADYGELTVDAVTAILARAFIEEAPYVAEQYL